MRRHRLRYPAQVMRPVLRTIPEWIHQVKHIQHPHPHLPHPPLGVRIQCRIPRQAADAGGVVGVVPVEPGNGPRVGAQPGHAPLDVGGGQDLVGDEGQPVVEERERAVERAL